jgi:DNA primase
MRRGDVIDYLMKRDNSTFAQAAEMLSINMAPPSPTAPKLPRPPCSADEEPPDDVWQKRAYEFIAYTQEQLWGEAGRQALAWLHKERGLLDETIRHFELGYNPSCLYDRPLCWGIFGIRSIYLSRGIIIPGKEAKTIWYIQIRRPYQPKTSGKVDTLHQYVGDPWPRFQPDKKYWAIRGGSTGLFGVDGWQSGGRPLLLCEGEFDAMLAWQEAGDLVDVATLGGAHKGVKGQWLFKLLPYQKIVAAYDADDAGRSGAKKLTVLSNRVLPVQVPLGKDLTDFHQAGGDLHAWVQSWLA